MRLFLLMILCAGLTVSAQVAVKGAKVYTMDGPMIENGVVLMKGGRIEAVGPANEVSIPEGYEVHEAAVVTPGLIDAHNVVGMTGYLNQDGDQDALESSSPMQPELRAFDAYNARERLVAWLREHGVTTMQTGHGPGALIAGQTMVVKTRGDSVDEAVLKPTAMLSVTLGADSLDRKKKPGTRGKQMAMLRAKFIKAQEYGKKLEKAEAGKEPPRDLAMEAMLKALSGEWPVLVTADRAQDILSALRLADEFKLKLVLDSGAEAYLVSEHLLKHKVPVIVHATMMRTYGEGENASMENAARLHEAGLTVAIQAGYEHYVPKTRVILFEAAIAAAYGLGMENALAAVTINAAEILGVADRVGSLKAGKDADVALFDGDPFEYTSHVTAVFIDGVRVSDASR